MKAYRGKNRNLHIVVTRVLEKAISKSYTETIKFYIVRQRSKPTQSGYQSSRKSDTSL